MDQIKIDETECVGCFACAASCPVGALSIGDGKPNYDPNGCIGCLCCVDACPVCAIEEK